MINILFQPWGGLGDNLQYSTLPERFAKKNQDVCISSQNVYRNLEIKELVWDSNPFVKGVSSENPNIGSCIHYERKYKDKSIVFNQEYCHGLEPINEIPKIFYQPKKITNIENFILIDISSKSHDPFIPNNLNDFIKSNFSNKSIATINFKKLVNSKKIISFNFDFKIDVHSIFEYIDIINSCDFFICSFSGQSVLASAIDKKNTLCFIRQEHKNIDYCFPNIKYQIV